MHSVLKKKNPLQYVHRPLLGNIKMKVQVASRQHLESPNFMKCNCHALTETLNCITEKN